MRKESRALQGIKPSTREKIIIAIAKNHSGRQPQSLVRTLAWGAHAKTEAARSFIKPVSKK